MINLNDCEFIPRDYPDEYSVYLNTDFVGVLRKLDFIVARSIFDEPNQQITDELYEYIKLKNI